MSLLAFAFCTTNYSLFIVCLSSCRNMSSFPSLPTFQLFHLFMKNKLYSAKKCNTEFLCTIVSRVSLSTALQGASPLVRWASFEVLQYWNRANSSEWNVGIILTHSETPVNHTNKKKKKEKKTHRTYTGHSLAKVGICNIIWYKTLGLSVFVFHNSTFELLAK